MDLSFPDYDGEDYGGRLWGKQTGLKGGSAATISERMCNSASTGLDTLRFEHQLIHVFALEPNNDDPPAGLILTTETDPGSPGRHRSAPPLRYLYRGQETIQIGFIPLVQMEHITGNLNEAERVVDEVLWGKNYALHEESGIFCLWCCNPGSFARTGAGEPIPVYRVPGGYMLQFNPAYEFTPQEMAVD